MSDNNRIILDPGDVQRDMGEALMTFINRLCAVYPRLSAQIHHGFAVIVATPDGKQIVIQGNNANPDQIFRKLDGAGMPGVPPLIHPGA